MNNSTNYQCPACSAPLKFSSKLGKLECEYCGSVYEVSEIDKLYGEEVEKSAQQSATEEKSWDGIEMQSFHCESCGAEIICEKTTVATSCPYCSNTTIIPQQFTGGRMPDYVIPFAVDKKSAIEGLKEHYKGRKLLPKVFSAENHIEEIKGVYVPFWLYDGSVDFDISFDATKTNGFKQGDYMVTQTSHFIVDRTGNLPFEKISVDASRKMDDALMDSLEPFSYEQLKPFTASYLPGYLAESYDVSMEECEARMKNRAEASAVTSVQDNVKGYATTNIRSKKLVLHNDKVSYAFMPVWLLSTKWRDKNFIFAMNGQTGKMVGELPVDKKRYWGYFALITGIVTVAGTILMRLFF